ncbi:MAG TPA: FMN-dependent NADH-azoreductase [Deferribacteraceae bacterium]|nr:FMN-dependent NADH-azoreductase [Deferribacteraceae bacterium]
MATLLYVTCSIKPKGKSRSMMLGDWFLEKYLELNPDDRIEIIDTYKDPVQKFDCDVMNGICRMREGEALGFLSDNEQIKIAKIYESADKFAAADKYVFVTPMWNLGFPPELKMYLDTVCIPGKTFVHTENGPAGLLRGKGRRCLSIHSSGWYHHGKESDHSVPYLKSIMSFMGVEDFRTVLLEGLDAEPHMAEIYFANAMKAATKAAAEF